jgi:hypothetical protein
MNISSYLPADDQNTTRAGGNNPRALRDLLARYCNPHLQRTTINRQKSVYQNLSMGKSYEPRKIF